jgi:hypothetical protein
MKLPVQAPAVVRGSSSWPTRRPARGSTEPAIGPSAGSIIKCTDPNYPNTCICNNGMATCCATDQYCDYDTGTGLCTCKTERP